MKIMTHRVVFGSVLVSFDLRFALLGVLRLPDTPIREASEQDGLDS